MIHRRGSVSVGRPFRDGRAFTLPEVAMAVIVLALALVTALSAMQRAFLSLDTARNLHLAASIMQTEIEKERLFNWTQLNNASYQPTIDASYLRDPAVAGRFAVSRTVTPVPQRG